MTQMAAVVAWFGPYKDISDAYAAAKIDYREGLYAVFGYQYWPARGRPRLLYVGVGDPISSRLSSSHHAIGRDRVEKITSIWLGSIDSHKVPGRRSKKIEPLIDSVEWAMIALLAPCLNIKKKSFPKESFAILNRWYSSGDYLTDVKKPALIWPDIIECAGPAAPAHLCWLEQLKVRRFARPPRLKATG